VLAGDSLANNDAFAIEDRILHYVDKLNAAHIAQHGGQYKGFAEIRNGYAYVTAQDDQDLAGNGSITRAVEVVESAGTVHISAGTFVEQVIVDGKRVTLQGQGEQTVIKSPTGMLAGSFTAGGAVYRPVVMVTNSDQAVIRDLKVDGNDNGQNNGQFLGVGYYNASGTIENLDVVNVRSSDSSGIQTGRAIYGRAEGDARQLNITNNRIANYQKNAIELHGSSLTAVVADNTMDGGGETSVIGRNGIVIRDGASGSVVSNTVSGHHFVDTASAQATASGILLYYSGVVTIGGNILSGNEAAIATLDAPTGTSITGNQFRVDDQARNVVDIEINGGDVAIGSGNKFGGTFFLQNYSANDYDLTGYTSEECDNLSNFEIENRIHHKMDDPALGLVMWVERNVFVTTPGVESTDSDIQRAINLAASGWTINVEAGTYAGGINVNKAGVKLVGHGLPSVGLATVDHYPTGILINADDVTVDGFKITGAGEAGNQWHGIRIKGDNVVVASNTISGVFDGIATSGVTNNHQLAFNTITDVTGAGIRMQNGGSGAVIDANTVTNAAAGVVLDSVQNVTISRNTLDNNTWDGIGMDGNVSGTIIRNSFIRGNLEHGIFIASGTGPTTIVDNHIAGNGIGLQNSGSGVAMVAQNWWGSPTGPTGAVNSDPNALGDKVIGLAQVAPWLTDGTDKELDMPGFQPDESSTFAPIWNDEDEFYSTIADALAGTNAGGTIYIQSSHYAESITIDKQIKLIAMDGEEEGGAVTVGSITLAGGADVSGSSGVTSADVTVQAGASVPQGILLASVGGTVTVEDGTYAGPIVVNKSITLKSRNLGGAVLNFSGQVSGLIVDADGVTIDGFKIAGNATTRFGVYIRGGAVGRTDVSIRNNEIYGVAGNIGSGYAIGILADANVGNAGFGVNSGLEIIDNIIRNIGGGTVQGAGMSLQEVEGDIPGAGAVVKGNAIHSLHGAEATGIQVADSGIGYNNNPSSGVQIIDNDIDAPAGIVVYAEGSSVGVGEGSFGPSTRLLVLNRGNHATVDEASLGQYARTDRPTTAAQFNATLVNASIGYARKAQDAISNSASGATVTLSAHTFVEDLTVSVNSLTLLGSGQDQTTIVGTNTAINVAANGLTIRDLTVTDSQIWNIGAHGVSGLTLENVTLANSTTSDGALISNASSVTITNVTATGNGRHGVNLNTVDVATVSGVHAYSNTGSGLNITRTLAGAAGGITVDSGTFTGNDIGINVYTNSGEVAGVSIEGEIDASGNGRGGIVLFAEGASDSITNVTIGQADGSAITLSGNQQVGVWVHGNVSNVTITGTFSRDGQTAAGVLVTGTDSAGSNSPQDVRIAGSSFIGYSPAAPAISLTTGDLDLVTEGVQSLASVNNVDARTGNSFDGKTDPNAEELAYIESLIVHKPDAGALGEIDLGLVDYTSLGNLTANVSLDTIDEGESITVNGSFTNEPKPHKVTIAWGDGSTTVLSSSDVTYDPVTGLFTFSATHTYADDPAGEDDVYPISITVEEDVDGSMETPATAQLQVTVNNVSPQHLAITPDGGNDYHEGQELKFTASATDPAGANDTLTYDWVVTKDGVEYVTGSGPEITFMPDDDGIYSIELTVTDEDGGLTTLTYPGIDVSNVSPTLTIDGAATVAEGATYTLNLSSSDPGTDTISKWTINWGDGTIEDIDGNPSSATHVYKDGPATYEISATATDEDGTYDAQPATVTVTVENVAPTVSLQPVAAISENEVAELTGTITDPGDPETFTLTIAWGDGSSTEIALGLSDDQGTTAEGDEWTWDAETRTFVVKHQYVDDDIYTIDVTVADDSGATGDAQTTATVTNVAPQIVDAELTESINENEEVELTGRIVDPGSADTFTLTIDWGEGDPQIIHLNGTPINDNGIIWNPDDRTFSVKHRYVDDDPTGTPSDVYTVQFTVTDDDGGSDSSALDTTVNNVAPHTVTIDGAPTSVPEGQEVSLTSTVIDASPNDTFTYLWTVTASNGQIIADGIGPDFSFTPNDNASAGPNPATYTVNLKVTDDDGGVAHAESNVISVIDVPPTVPLTGAESIDENQWYSLTIGPITDPGDNDVASISLIRIDWNGDGIYDQTLESGQLEELRDGNTVQLDHFYNDGPAGISKITVLVLNGDNTFTYNKPFTVNNLAPTASGFVATPNQVDAGTPGFVSFISPTDASPLDAASLRYAFDFNSDGIWDLGDGTSWALSAASTNPFADVPASFLSTPGTVTVTAVILDKDGGIIAPFTTDIQVGEVSFRVLSMVPTASGFDITFNRAVDPSELNLYYAEGIDDTTPDVQLIGPNGQVSGSFVLNANGTGGSFIATGGVLPAGTYTVILESGATAFKDTNGQALDGNADGDVGDAYIDSFTVANPGSARIVSVPDFARGPGQAVNVPGGSSQGLPITISNASGVTGIRFSLRYDPSLLTITNITRAQALVAAGWNNPVFNEIEPGLIEVSVNGANALASTNVTALVQIEATVPNDARYGASQVLRLEDVRVFAGEAQLPSLADWGTNKVTYLGDTTGNRAFTGADVALVSRVDVALDTGFASALLTDPRIIADINGDGFVDAGDAGLLASEANYYQLPEVFGSYNQPAIPDIPAWVQPLETPGYDPTISLPQNVLAGLGKTVVASLHLDVEPEASINGFTTTIAYDPSQLQISEADITFDNVTMSGWSVSPALVDGFIALTFSRIDSVTDAAGTIADLAFTVKPDATSGATTLDVGGLANDGNATYTHVDGSILIDAEAPAVTDILVKGSGWSAAFLQYLKDQGLGDGGFSRVTGADQLTALPWINIDQISIRFSEDVGASLGQDDLSLFGVDSTYAISGFAYDPLTYTATWTLGSAIGADKLLAAVAAAAVTDHAGNELDGEWTTGDTGNSGDGTPGGDFEFRFNVLPGDANRNGVANALDSNIVRSIQGAVPGIEAYSPFADVNGNAVINALDANIVRGLQGLTLPAGEPASPLALAATTFSGRSILDDLIDAEDEEELLLAV